VTNVGQVSFKMILDTSNLRGEVARVNALLSRQTIKIPVQLETGQLKAQLAQIAKEARSIKIPVQAGVSGGTSRGGGATAPAAPSRFEKDFEAALKNQAREAAALSREFEKTAAAAQRAADRAASISLRRQEREAASLAKETERAAAAQARLQQQSGRDKQTIAGANFSNREIKQVEAALKNVAKETKKAEELAALLRERYGLADGQAQNLARSLTGVRGEQERFSAAVAGLAGAASFMALNAALQALQDTVAGIINTFKQATEAYREFEKNLLFFESKTQGTNVNLEGLKEEILAVARVTSQTPQSLSAAASSLASFGVVAEDVEGRLAPLAKASDVLGEDPQELALVLQAASAAYGQYGVSIEEITDKIVQTINTTPIGARRGVREFEQLFSKAASLFASLGADFDELLALGAVFAEAGALPEASASAVETLGTRLISQADKFAENDIEIAVKENGGIDVGNTLQNLLDRTNELQSTNEKLNFLKGFLGESVSNDALLALSRLEGSYGRFLDQIRAGEGAVENTFGIVSQGADFQSGVIDGLFSAAFTSLGEALSPIDKGFIDLQQSVLGLTEVDLSPLADAAQRLGLALGENPELAEALGDALGGIAQEAVNQIANIIDALTALASNEDFITNVTELAGRLEVLIIVLGRVAQGIIGFVEILGSGSDAVAEARNPFSELTSTLLTATNPLFGLIGGFQNLVSAVQTGIDVVERLAGGFKFLTNRIIDSVPGLRLAIEALRRLRGERDEPLPPIEVPPPEQLGPPLPPRNPEPEDNRDRAAVRTAAQQQPQFNLVGDDATPERGRIRAQKDLKIQLAGIDQDDAEARIGLTERSATAEEFAEQEAETLQRRIEARQAFVDRLNELRETPGISADDALALDTAIADGEKELAGDRLTVAQNLQRDRKRILDNINRDSAESLKRLERDSARAALTTAQSNLSAGENALAGIRNERTGIQGRLTDRESVLNQLRQRQQAGGLSDEDSRALNQQIVDTEKEIYDLRLGLLDNFRTERKQIIDNIVEDSAEELSSLDRDSARTTLETAQAPLTAQESALAGIRNERTNIQGQLGNRENLLTQLRNRQKAGGLSPEDARALNQQIVDTEKELYGLRLGLLNNFRTERKQIIDNLVKDSAEELNALDRDSARVNLETAQAPLTAQESTLAGIRNERTNIQGRLGNREELLTQLRNRQQAGGLSPEDARALDQQIVDTEKEIYGLRLGLLNSFRTERKQTLDNIQADSQRQLSALERDQAAAAAAIAESPLTDRERTDATVQVEQASLQQRLANQQNFLEELKRQQEEGGLSPEAAQALGDQIISVETGIYNIRTQLANSFEAERKRLAEQGFADQLQLLNQIKEQEALRSGQQTTGIQNQQQLIDADTGLVNAEAQLDQARLNTALATAQVEAETATNKRQSLAAQRDINKLQVEALNSQVDATARELAAKRNNFNLSAKLARLESQRAIQSAEIAALEADIAVRRAIAAGATQQEVNGLQQVANLLQDQIDVVKQSAVVTDQVLNTKAETLTVEEKIAEEQLKQNGIIAQGTRLLDARKGMISALAATSNTTPQEGLENLDRIRERFRDARSAGLFRGENVNGAISQVESALRGGNDRRLFQLAQSDNPLISQLIDAAGRSDITGLVNADKELALAKSVEDGNTRIVDRLDTIIEQGGLGARIENLIVATPDSVADTSRIVSDVANLQSAGVNV
jgi:TP901 family phage tail tape measure protein